jgi:DsbC/DsbD-like thiol-disulfide interchange protein
MLAAAALTHQVAAQAPEVDVGLVPEVVTVRPGTAFRVGVRLRIPTGWHIYWTNPGQAGGPTTLKWRVHPEIEHRGTEWPLPVREDSSGIISHVYRGDVALVSTFGVASSTSLRTVDLAASLTWVICREICVPQRRDVRVSLPLGTQTAPPSSRWSAFYTAARPQLPQAPDGIVLRAIARDHGLELVIRLRDANAAPPASATFFPEERGAAAVVLKPRGVQGGVAFEISDPLEHRSKGARLRGVLVLEPDRALLLDVPVETASS